MIIQIHAYVFNTSVGQWIVIYQYLRCTPPIKIELIALFFTIAGQVLMMFDPNAEREDGKTGSALIYIVCLVCGIAGAGYFLLSDNQMKKVPFCFFFTVICFHLFIINTLFAKIEDSETKFWSTDPVYGVFGFFDRS